MRSFEQLERTIRPIFELNTLSLLQKTRWIRYEVYSISFVTFFWGHLLISKPYKILIYLRVWSSYFCSLVVALYRLHEGIRWPGVQDTFHIILRLNVLKMKAPKVVFQFGDQETMYGVWRKVFGSCQVVDYQ